MRGTTAASTLLLVLLFLGFTAQGLPVALEINKNNDAPRRTTTNEPAPAAEKNAAADILYVTFHGGKTSTTTTTTRAAAASSNNSNNKRDLTEAIVNGVDDAIVSANTVSGGDGGDAGGGDGATPINAVMAYDGATGEELGQVTDPEGFRELRGMYLLPSNGHLLVANAYKKDSRIVEFGPCTGSGRALLKTLISNSDVMVHPYGMAVHSEGEQVFVSSQDGNVSVSYFDLDSGSPLPSLDQSSKTAAAGTVLTMDPQGATRGILVFDDILLLARENKNDVHVYQIENTKAGGTTSKVTGLTELGKVHMDSPIGLATNPDHTRLFVSTNSKENSSVCMYSIQTTAAAAAAAAAPGSGANDVKADIFPLLGCVNVSSIGTHPTGMAVSSDGQKLYVLIQNPPTLASIRMSAFAEDEENINNNINNPIPSIVQITPFHTQPEQILLSPCFN